MRPTIVGLSGNVRQPSRTASLVDAIAERAASRIGGAITRIDLGASAPSILSANMADGLDAKGRALVSAVEQADIIIAGSPVYRASYTGVLKHLFDLVNLEALAGKPVILCATGGTPMHGLMLEHSFRPLFAFFKALPLPTSVYALESDFQDYRLTNPEVSARIDQAITELVHIWPASADLRQARVVDNYRINPGSRLRAL